MKSTILAMAISAIAFTILATPTAQAEDERYGLASHAPDSDC